MFVFYVERILVAWRGFRKKLDLNGGQENVDAATFYSIFVPYFDLQSSVFCASNSSNITEITVMVMAARVCWAHHQDQQQFLDWSYIHVTASTGREDDVA
jgi:hypothetical protein